ncbi:hypothetical protein LQ567_04055 [Niabella pedocola]|uniref:Uncharacterized protein n=1 Tax=Niabella pedocola TaxID=1752077 RepID=A0ABS8PNN6_9BACT|nr:hypothetical protein [Niabella pedocola]MCD2421922.1 hypothetical protein [Niabella pedocola]
MCKFLFLAAIPVFFFLGSCSGSKVLPAASLHMDAATTRDYPSRFYDDHTQIRYDFRNDDQYLYVILETDNPAARMRMLREGVKIYFSPSSAKSETRLVEYPFHPDHEKAPVDRHRTTGAGSTGQPEAGIQRTDERDYTSFYKQARLTDKGKVALVDAADTAPGVLHFKAANEADGFFRYTVSIPKSQLMIHKGQTIIGIRIPEMKQARDTYSGRGTPATHMSAGGGRGGMHGGGGGGMRGKGGMYGRGTHNSDGESNTLNHGKEDVSGKVDWWYKIGLVS